MSGLVIKHALCERGDDCYQTPAVATEALLRVEQLPHRLWEPAAGRGAIVNVLRAAGHEVIASELVDYGDPTHFPRRDFLLERRAPEGCQGIVTNPPFRLVEQFIAHALELCPLVAMPLRFGFYAEGCGRTRKAALRRHVLNGGRLARVHVFVRRLPMMHRWQGPKASNPTAYAWFVWNTRHVGPPTLHRIPYDACEDGR